MQLSRTPGALPVMENNPDVKVLLAFKFEDFTLSVNMELEALMHASYGGL